MKKSISSIFFFLILSNYLLAQIAEEKLDYNNTRVTIRSGGDFFKEGYQGGFEVPKQQPNTNRTSTIFTAGLWIGGIDEDSAIHLAAMTYRQRGRDFWPGPIGSPPSDENKYNRVFKVSRADILTHKRDPSATTLLSIIEWPGNGDTTLGEPYQLAPFVDMNNNGSYEPRLGDYPKIKGIGAAYCVYNDAAEHSQSGALPLGVEVHQLFYQDTITVNGVLIDDINLATFTLINRSENTYRNFRLGIFTDYDLGNFNDDFVGCDPSIDLSFVYNGDDNDEGTQGYGTTPPVQGLAFLSNKMDAFVTYSNSANAITGNPFVASDFYNYMNSKWRIGTPIVFGGNGILQSTNQAKFMYPFNKDPSYPDENWNEGDVGNTPGDRRGLASTAPIILHPGEVVCYNVAFIYARAVDGDALESIKTLKVKTRLLKTAYHNNLFGRKTNCILGAQQADETAGVEPSIIKTNYTVYPNPGSGVFYIQNLHTQNPILLMNALGKILDVIEPHRTTFDMSERPSGVYFLKTDKCVVRFIVAGK